MKFQKLGKKERELLLLALNISKDNLVCQFCGEKVKFDDCGIMPPVKTKAYATFTCNSPLCICEYLNEVEE